MCIRDSIQCVGKEKEPLVSFLEPVSPVIGLGADNKSEPTINRASPSSAYSDVGAQLVPKDNVSDGNIGSSECSEDKICAESLVVCRGNSETSSRQNVQIQQVPETTVSLPQSGSSSSNNNLININNRVMSGLNCVMDLTRKSPISASAISSGNNGRSLSLIHI